MNVVTMGLVMDEDEKTLEQHKAELIASYSLTPAMLNRKVSDRDIVRLERIVTESERLARQLLLDWETFGHTDSMTKDRMLEIWLKRKGIAATFDVLITAMLKAGQRSQAEKVCKMLNPGQCEREISLYKP